MSSASKANEDSGIYFNQSTSNSIAKKEINPLVKFLLCYKYYEQSMSFLPIETVPKEFDNTSSYRQIFQVLFYTHNPLSLASNYE